MPYDERVTVDVGTGDGAFVYRAASQDPGRLYIGIDINASALEKISERITRKPSKGGRRNLLFVQAAVEDLPTELDGIADQVYVNLPWGSLLRGVAFGEESILANLRRICAPGASLEVLLSLHAARDRSEIERLGLDAFTSESVDGELRLRYLRAGFTITEHTQLPASVLSHVRTSWARRLRCGTGRTFTRLTARADHGAVTPLGS